MEKIEKCLAHLEENKRGMEEQIKKTEDSFIDFASKSEISDDAISEEQIKRIKQNLENKKEFVEAQFENMRPKIEKMMARLDEKMTKVHLNESEMSDSEKEFGIQASQEMQDAETQASN